MKLRSAVLGAQEYFLLENRQRVSGSYDEYLPGSGLLIWHVDEAMNVYAKQNDYECTFVPPVPAVPHCQCDDNYHYLLALEQADGLSDLERAMDGGDSGDPFPGNTANRTWTMLTDPESSSWYGGSSNTPPAGPGHGAAGQISTAPGEAQAGRAAITADLWVTCGPAQDRIAFPLEGRASGAACANTCIGVTNIRYFLVHLPLVTKNWTSPH